MFCFTKGFYDSDFDCPRMKLMGGCVVWLSWNLRIFGLVFFTRVESPVFIWDLGFACFFKIGLALLFQIPTTVSFLNFYDFSRELVWNLVWFCFFVDFSVWCLNRAELFCKDYISSSESVFVVWSSVFLPLSTTCLDLVKVT